MYERLIKAINQETVLQIMDNTYHVLSKAFYISKNEKSKYVKLVLSGNKCLVIIPSDELLYLGEIINPLPYSLNEKFIQYDSSTYKNIGRDYQIVDHVEFGNIYEKECDFADYEEINGSRMISLAILSVDQKRADVLATILSIDQISIK